MRKYKMFLTAFILLMTLFVFSVNASDAETAVWENGFYYEVVDGEAIIRRCGTSGIKNLVIPETLGGYPVTEITMERYASDIESKAITLPKTLKRIGNVNNEHFFEQLYVDSIETWLNITENNSMLSGLFLNTDFYVDGKIVTDIVIPDSKTEINTYAFHGLKINSVTFSESIQSVSTHAFDGTSLKKVYVPDLETWFRISNICTYTDPEIYINNEKPVDIVIPENVDTIPNYAFEDFYLKSITFTTPIKEFGYYWLSPHYMVDAFYVDSFETWMNFNFEDYPLDRAKCLYIDGEAIEGDYVFPETCTRISNRAFYKYKALKSITLHPGIEHIGDYAFYGTGIESVYVDSLETWFKICDNIYKSNGQATYKANPMCVAQNLYVAGELLVDLVIPETITEIPVYGLYGIKTLKSVTLHSGIEYIGEYAFKGTGVENIYIDSLESWFRICVNIYKDNSGATHFANPMSYAKNLYVAGELLVDLVIPETVTEIPAYGLYNIKSIKSVTFHSGITTVHNHSFNSCTNIKEVYVPDIGTYARVGAVNQSSTLDTIYVDGEPLVNLVVPEGVTELPAKIFKNYKKLESATISGSVKSIGDSAFEGCTNLKTITMAYGIESIGKNAFSGCINLESVYVPSIESWLNTDFVTGTSNPLCNNAKLYIDGELFENFVVDEKSTSVPANTFVNYGYLKSVTLHENITSIGGNAFSGCTNLESVYAPSLESWLNIDFGSERANPLCNGAKLYIDGVLLENLRVPESIIEIKQYAFYGYGYLEIFEITGNLSKIGNYAFSSACKDMKVHVETVTDWLNISIYSSGNPLKCGADIYIDGEKPTEVVIPEGVKEFSAESFDYWRSLKKITIPSTAFIYHNFNNTSIEEVVVGSLTEKIKPIKTITYLLFRDNKKIKKITFGYGVKSIGEKAFEGMTNLKEVVFYDGIEEIGVRAFCDTGITSITIPSTVKSVKGGAFAYCDELVDITLGDVLGAEPVVNIENETFRNCPKLAKVTFNSGVKEIGAYTFSNSLKIENVYINDLVSYLGIKTPEDIAYGQYALPTRWSDNVYVNGEILKNLVIPEGVTRIGNSAFCNVETLETVKFPSTLKEIHANAFASCWNLKDFTFPESLETIGEFAFFGCSQISKLELKKNVKSVGMSAFDYCTGLKTVYMYPQMLGIAEGAFGECKNIELILYTGTKEAWDKLLKENKNTGLEGVAVLYRFRPESMRAPEAIYSQQTTDSVTLSWTKINGASGYKVFVKEGSGWKNLKTLKDNTYKVTGLKTGTRYTFAVRAYISSGALVLWAPEYTTHDTATRTVKPSKVTATTTTSSIKLTWPKTAGATGYRIFYKTANGWSVCVSSTTATAHTFNNLKSGLKFTLAVRPYISTNSGIVWSDYTQVSTATQPVKPASVTASQTTSTLKLSWTPCSGATGYRIFRKSGTGWTAVVGSTAATSYTFKNLKAGSKFVLAVRPYIQPANGVVWGAYTQITTATLPANVTAKVTTPAKGRVTLTWNAVSGADSYLVYYRVGNGAYQLYKTCTGLFRSRTHTFQYRMGDA